MRVGWMFFAAMSMLAQDAAAPAFDVVSVKHSGDVQMQAARVGEGRVRPTLRGIQISGGRLTCHTPMINILTDAYDLRNWQIQGPKWIETETYELTATMPDQTPRETARRMLQTMLADRFGLKARREQKEFQVYAMVVADAKKLEEVKETPGGFGFRMGLGMMEAENGMPLGGLAGMLTRAAGRPVLDETGLKGNFKVKLHWNADPPATDGTPVRLGVDPGMLSAVSQVGLKLEPQKRTLDNLVIETISKEPTAN